LVIDGLFDELIFNGVDVMPLWHAEMARLHPEFSMLTPEDADGHRAVWPLLEQQWAGTIDRARALPEELLHDRVDGEWSFIQTLRHLVFVHDAWLRRAVLGETDYDPLGLPSDEMPDIEGVPRDSEARPTLDHVLTLRARRCEVARQFFDELTDELLKSDATVTGPGYPEPGTYAVSRCLHALLDDEWWHRRFAERDLAVLEQRVRVTPGR
jgi:uncharacterized damage-inducible protein DinB